MDQLVKFIFQSYHPDRNEILKLDALLLTFL